MTQILLASSSPYRKQLLEKINLDFICLNPDIDETPLPNETPPELVARLALEKANRIAEDYRDRWIVGSDQTASFKNQLIGKPGTTIAAEQQLTHFSGHSLRFYTSVCLINRELKFQGLKIVETNVKFRELSHQEIAKYVALDNPVDCAGSFKAESLGISLFESLESKDPTALIGLPLISLCRLMQRANIW